MVAYELIMLAVQEIGPSVAVFVYLVPLEKIVCGTLGINAIKIMMYVVALDFVIMDILELDPVNVIVYLTILYHVPTNGMQEGYPIVYIVEDLAIFDGARR